MISKKANTIVIAGASGFIGSNILKQKDLFPYNLFIPVTRRDIPDFIKVENYAATAAAVIRYTSIEVALKIDQKAF